MSSNQRTPRVIHFKVGLDGNIKTQVQVSTSHDRASSTPQNTASTSRLDAVSSSATRPHQSPISISGPGGGVLIRPAMHSGVGAHKVFGLRTVPKSSTGPRARPAVRVAMTTGDHTAIYGNRQSPRQVTPSSAGQVLRAALPSVKRLSTATGQPMPDASGRFPATEFPVLASTGQPPFPIPGYHNRSDVERPPQGIHPAVMASRAIGSPHWNRLREVALARQKTSGPLQPSGRLFFSESPVDSPSSDRLTALPMEVAHSSDSGIEDGTSTGGSLMDCMSSLNSGSSTEPTVAPTASGLLFPPKRRQCSCTKSMCLKLYCDCFAHGELCDRCNCIGCHNNADHEEERSMAVKATLERNPHAFQPKIC